MEIPTAVVMAVGYVILAGILGLEWGLCVSLTGTLWVGISEHFFNNFIGNTLHVVTESGTDELQIARIVLSNILSLTIVLIVNRYKKKHLQKT
ncbi:putative membrane protein [Faecalicatena orotica]